MKLVELDFLLVDDDEEAIVSKATIDLDKVSCFYPNNRAIVLKAGGLTPSTVVLLDGEYVMVSELYDQFKERFFSVNN